MKKSLSEKIYISSTALLAVSRIMESSTLFNFSNVFYNILTVVSVFLLVLAYILIPKKEKTNDKKLYFVGFIISVLTVLGAPVYMLIAFLLYLSIKNIDVRKVIKIDIVVKAIFLCLHAVMFIIYVTSGRGMTEYVFEGLKGTGYSLLFANPNTAGLIGTWLAMEILYIRGEKNIKSYIIPTIIAIVTFMITASRTPFFAYILFVFLRIIKDDKVLSVLQKIVYPILFLISLFMVTSISYDNQFFAQANQLLSGRLSHSIIAVQTAGIHFLPNILESDFFTQSSMVARLTIDNFFVRGFIQYGIITLLLYYYFFLKVPKSASRDSKRISIIFSIYLFFEVTVAYAGFNIPLLIAMDSIRNQRSEACEKAE
jgi:hypothetical protein